MQSGDKHMHESIYYIYIENKNNIPRVKLYLKLLGYEKTNKINSRTKAILIYYKEISIVSPEAMLSDFIATTEKDFIAYHKSNLIIPERIEKLKSIL